MLFFLVSWWLKDSVSEPNVVFDLLAGFRAAAYRPQLRLAGNIDGERSRS